MFRKNIKIKFSLLILLISTSLYANTYTYTNFNESEYEKVKDAYDLKVTYSQTGKEKFYFVTKLMDYKVDDSGNQIVSVLTSTPVNFELIHRGDQLPRASGMDSDSVVVYVHQDWNFDKIIFVIDAIKTLPHKFVFDTTYMTTDNLYLRNGQGTSNKKITMLKENSFVYILEVGKEETIDGIKSNWVKIKTCSGTLNGEGKEIKQGTEGWCFGGFLQYSR